MKLTKDDKGILGIMIGFDLVVLFLIMESNHSTYDYPLHVFMTIVIFAVINFFMGIAWGQLMEIKSQDEKKNRIRDAVYDILNSRRKGKVEEALDVMLNPGQHSSLLAGYGTSNKVIKPKWKYLPNSFTELSEILAWVSVFAGIVLVVLRVFSINLWWSLPITVFLTFFLIIIARDTQDKK